MMTQSPTYPDLAGASVFITGGGSGIGAALTEAFLRQGAKVAFVQRSDASAFADDMARKTGNRPLFLQCDMDINLKAYFFAAQAVIAGMKSHGSGSIINFSSISYMMGAAGFPLYTTANSGINGLTRSLAREFGPDRIRVNALAPGWVLTQRQKDLWVTPEGLAAHVDRQCLKDTLAPEDIAGGVLFLASGASRMMTGQALVIDGGLVVTG